MKRRLPVLRTLAVIAKQFNHCKMANDVCVLKITKMEFVHSEFMIFQGYKDSNLLQKDSGVAYYYNGYEPQELYVQYQGKLINAELPTEGVVMHLMQHSDELYFTFYSDVDRKQQIYKVVCAPRSAQVIYVRDKMEGEEFGYGTWCTRMQDGKRLVYRSCDDPFTDGIIVDLTEEELEGLVLREVHRGVVFYQLSTSNINGPAVRRLRENVVVIEYNGRDWNMLKRESDQFAYLSIDGQIMCTLDTNTMEIIQTSKIQGVQQIMRIIDVRDGEFSAQCLTKSWTGELEQFLITAAMDQEVFRSRFPVNFEIHTILGSGTYGTVFEVTSKLDQCPYAVKRITVKLREKSLDEALREVCIMARLDHPGIVRYNSTWVEEPPDDWQMETDLAMLNTIGESKKRYKSNFEDFQGSAFIYVQMHMGEYSLDHWLEKNTDPSTRSLSQMKSWFKQMIEAVAYIHKANIIHRDLKPANILVFKEDKLKLCDLGIATERATRSGATMATRTYRVGTPLYMSPEQMSVFPEYSSKADVFALGLIFAELCVVMVYDDRCQIFENYRAGMQCDRISDSETAEVIAKFTQLDPDNRPSCQEMLDHEYFRNL